jgi:hypothetical protein
VAPTSPTTAVPLAQSNIEPVSASVSLGIFGKTARDFSTGFGILLQFQELWRLRTRKKPCLGLAKS